MKNSESKMKMLLNGYVKWLSKYYYYYIGDDLVKFKSPLSYSNYMEKAILDLGITVEEFIKYSQPGLLKVFLKRLQEATSFVNRDIKLQSDIISAFKTYINYRKAVAK